MGAQDIDVEVPGDPKPDELDYVLFIHLQAETQSEVGASSTVELRECGLQVLACWHSLTWQAGSGRLRWCCGSERLVAGLSFTVVALPGGES